MGVIKVNMMKYRIRSKGAYKNFIGVLVLGVVLVAQLLCSQECTLPYVKGYISKWVFDSLRATWLIRVNRVYGDTVVGDSFDFTAGFIDHVKFDSAVGSLVRITSVTDTLYGRPTSLMVDSVLAGYVSGTVSDTSLLHSNIKDYFTILYGDSLLSKFQRVVSATDTGWLRPTSARFDSLIGVNGSIDTLKSAKGGFTNLAVGRCSTSGKVTLVHDTVYLGILTYRSPARTLLTGEFSDTIAIFTRDSLGTILLKAWMSRRGIWYNANGDSANYGGSPGGPVDWEDILNKPSCFISCSHNHLWADLTDPPAIPGQYDSAGVAGVAHLARNADSLNHKGPAYYTDTTRYKACSTFFNTRIVNDSTNAFELTARKGAASGYAGLGANGYVPTAQLGSGSASASTYLRGDQAWATPAGGGGSSNPGAAVDWQTMDSWDAITKYVMSTANWAYWTPIYNSCSLIVTKFMFRGRLQRGSDFGIYDSLGTRLWSTGTIKTALSALCSLTVTPTLRLGPGQYYVAWACSSASYDTVYGVAQPVAGMIRRSGWKATSCPLPASFDPNTLTLEVRRLWFNLRRF